jgi:hypothetical protein
MSTTTAGPSGVRTARSGRLETWTGGWRRYDLVKEFVIALVVVALLTVALAVVFSSPDDPPVTIARWANADPKDFLATAVSELDRSSEVAKYGPPYTHTPDAAQKIGPICLQCIPGVRLPVDTAKQFVLGPLSEQARSDPALAQALAQYRSASASQQAAWTDAYTKAVDQVTFQGGQPVLPPGDYGPVPTMLSGLLTQARAGGLDGALLATKQFYQTDYTKPILFISGGSYFEDQAAAKHLLGEQWGMMNETGNWPGQPWLWLYTLWYQIKPFSTSGNADALIWGIMLVLTLALILVPFVPGVRSIPRWIPLHRLIWRDYYRQVEGRRR